MGQDEYVEVYAEAIYAKDVGNPSGDEETTFAHVNWTAEGGFTGSGWYTEEYTIYDVTGGQYTVTGPLYGLTKEGIQQIIESHGNLNDQFDAWENGVGANIKIRSGWINYVHSKAPSCVN